MISTDSNIKSHTGVLSVVKGLFFTVHVRQEGRQEILKKVFKTQRDFEVFYFIY